MMDKQGYKNKPRLLDKINLVDLIYNHLGDRHYIDGSRGAPPGSSQKLEFGEADDDGRPMLVATTYNNDGHELWIGYRTEWLVYVRTKQAVRLAWFILWTWWGRGQWFGIKKRIWYWALGKRCDRLPLYRSRTNK